MSSLYAVDLPTLEQVMECSPLTVLPDTPLLDVIALMNPVSSSTVESASDVSSCVLVVEEKSLVGIFTLRDVVRLTGAGVNVSRAKISEVMTQQVISLTRATAQNALTALAFMRQHQIRHLPVVDEQGQLLGLITQDRIRLVIQPAHLLKLRCVTEVMVREVIHALPTTSVLELSQMMSARRISCVVIVAPQETTLIPVGMITEKDILKAQLQGLDIAQTQVQAVMSTPVLSISPSESLWTVQQLMQERGVRRLVVVGEQGELQGLVTQTNFLQVLDPLEIVSVIQALQTKVEEQTLQLQQSNQQLENEVRQRRQVEESLRQAQQELELRVVERTAELVQANLRLQEEIQERTKAEAALQLNQFCIDRARDAIACIDPNGRYVYVNDTLCHALNYSREELLLMSVYDINVDISTPVLWSDFWQRLKQQGYMVFESHHRRQDGQILPVEIAVNYIQFQGQEFAWGFARDITERKQAEVSLRESEQRLQAIIDNSPSIIYLKDMQGRHILVNSEFERIAHLTREQIKNKTNAEIFSPDIAQVFNRNDENVLRCGTPLQLEEELQFDDGLHTYLTIKFLLCDADDQPYAICGISTDITERKKTEQALSNIAAGVSATTGETFFQSLVQYLASALQVDYALVATVVNVSNPYMKTIAVFANGTIMDNFEYDLANTPCNNVLTQKLCVHTNNVQQEFPQDTLLADFNVESYVGSPLFDSTGSVIGVMVIMHRQPLPQIQLAVSVLQTFASRAATELERKQTEADLQQSERKLRAIFDSSFQFMGLLTTEGIVIDANRASLNIIAANLSDVVGKPFWETPWWSHFPEQQLRLRQAIARAANGEFVRLENKHIWVDGTLAFVDFSLKPIFDEAGNVVMLVPEGRDITERKQSELEIRKFVSLADNSTEFIGMCDLNFVPFYVNPAGMQLVGLNDIHQYSKTPVREFFFPEDQDFIINEFFPRVLREERAEVEIRFRHFKTGEALWMVYSVFCVKDMNDQLIGLASVSRNITERKLAEQKIAEQAALIDIATDAIFVRDLEHRILFWSRGAENLYGWTAEESVGKLAHELLHTESLSQLEAAVKTTVEQGSWQGELQQSSKTGKGIIVASRWTLIHNQFGQAQSILVVNSDITEKKQLEQQFYRAQRLESIGTLASGIAHDLNNVFAPIVMIAQLLPLRCKHVDARTQELFKTLETSSKRGSDLVKQILTFARGTEGQQILLQPGHLLKELVKVIKQTFPKSIEIRSIIPTNTLWMVKADPTQLEQVFMNLAVNARDAMPNGGTLTITTANQIIDETYARMHLEAQPGSYIVVTISDTGTGIAPEILERIFDPFFTTKEVGKGTGLGLSTVLGIVKNHGGFLEVASQVGKGTQFQVFLPRGEGQATEVTTETELPRGNGQLILVVDDEAVVQQITQETLVDYNQDLRNWHRRSLKYSAVVL